MASPPTGASLLSKERSSSGPAYGALEDGQELSAAAKAIAAKTKQDALARIAADEADEADIARLNANVIEDKASLLVIMWIVLVGDSCRGILFPTLWPYVTSMGGDKITQGMCVAAFSLGRIVSAPYVGRWAIDLGNRPVLQASSLIVCVGALAYVLAENNTMLVLAQCIMGVGTGTLGVTRGYVADKTTPEQRTYLLAYLTAVQYGGFTVMPFVGGFLAYVFRDVDAEIRVIEGWISLQLNMYTAPAYFLVLMSAATILLLSKCFNGSLPKERMRSLASQGKLLVTPPPPRARKTISTKASSQGQAALERQISQDSSNGGGGGEEHDQLLQQQQQQAGEGGIEAEDESTNFKLAIAGGFLLNIATKGTISCFETLGAEYIMTHFGLTAADAGFIFPVFGATGVVALLSMRALCRYFSDIQMVLGGVAVMMISCALLVTDPEGIAQLNVFLVSLACMYATGYPVGHTAVLGLFSKVVGKRPQSELLGWFGSAGSLARIFFPIMAGVISEERSTGTLMEVLICILGVAFAGLLASRKTYMAYANAQ